MQKIGLEGCRALRKEFLEASQVKRKARLLEMRVLLSGSKAISDTSNADGSQKYGFAAAEVVLCTAFLVRVLSVHRNLASSVLRRPSALSLDLPGRHVNSSSNGTFESSVVSFLITLADEVGDSMPNSIERHLPHRNKKLVYVLYCESERTKQDRFCTRSHFYRTWKALAPHIKCRKAHAFSICDTCISFSDRLMHLARKSSRDREREHLLKGFRSHLREVKLERAEYARNRLNAAERPGEVLSVIIDGADQTKFGIPRFIEKSKSESGHAIKQKITGVLFHSGLRKDDFMAYLSSSDNLPGGANQTIDAFSRCFLVLLEHRAFMHNLTQPKQLYVQLDNTGKDNKNRYFMAFCEWLIYHGIFECIHVNFLPVGHTHEDVDRKFSRVSVALSCQDTISIQDLHRAIRNSVSSSNKPHVARIRGYNNFSQALERQSRVVKSIPGFSTYRKFVFRRDSVIDLQSKVHEYYVSCHVAPSMTTPQTDWERLQKPRASIGCFLVSDIDLERMPPALYTKVAECDIRQMKKRIHSVETRINCREKYQELLEYIDDLNAVSVAKPEWSPHELLQKRLKPQNAISFPEDSESDDEQTYNVGDMVTVRHTKGNTATPFWVGSITDVNPGKTNEVEVCWYEIVCTKALKNSMEPSNASFKRQPVTSYSGKYRPCTTGDSRLLCDTIPTKSILVRFDQLTASCTLPVLVQKNTRQALDPFEEYIGDEEGEEASADDSENDCDVSNARNGINVFLGSDSESEEQTTSKNIICTSIEDETGEEAYVRPSKEARLRRSSRISNKSRSSAKA